MNYPVPESSEVGLLIKEIENVAKAKGLILGRWQANSKRNWRCTTITYAFYPTGTERPQYTRGATGPQAVLSQWEGETKRCTAYRVLSELLVELKGE